MAPPDKRAPLLQLLEHYQPINKKDDQQRHLVMEFVQKNSECFERSLNVGHLTGSAWVVDPSHNQVLLTHHKKLGKWLQLGGHADGNSNLFHVALKEAQEESGLSDLSPITNDIFDLDVHLIPKREREPAHYHYDVRFAFQTQTPGKIQASSESYEIRWVPLTQLESYSPEPSLLRMRTKWRDLIKI